MYEGVFRCRSWPPPPPHPRPTPTPGRPLPSPPPCSTTTLRTGQDRFPRALEYMPHNTSYVQLGSNIPSERSRGLDDIG